MHPQNPSDHQKDFEKMQKREQLDIIERDAVRPPKIAGLEAAGRIM